MITGIRADEVPKIRAVLDQPEFSFDLESLVLQAERVTGGKAAQQQHCLDVSTLHDVT